MFAIDIVLWWKVLLNLVLQEKLQNAEDAGASEIRFILDSQSYAEGKLMRPDSGKNDLTRMQVNKDTFLILSSKSSVDVIYLSISKARIVFFTGCVSLCVQRCRVHRERLGRDKERWIQREEGKRGQSREIWHGLQLSLPLNRSLTYSYLHFLLHLHFILRFSLDLVRNKAADDGPNPSTPTPTHKDVGLLRGNAQEELGRMERRDSTLGPDARYSWTPRRVQWGTACRNLVPAAPSQPDIQIPTGC